MVRELMKTIGWGILFASPFIVMCFMIWVIYT